MSGPNALPDIVIKLGLANQAKEDSIFRRITPQQLRKSKYRPVDGLKVHGALLSLSLCEEPAGFDVEQFDVSLTYMDRDGDKVLIHTRDDLIAAMDEYAELKKLKVFADVKRSPKPPSRAPPRAEAPSVDSATQTPRAAKNRRSAPVPVQEVVESLVGLLADATTTAANAVHSHLNEHSAVAPRASARAPPQEKPQSAVAKQDLAPSKPSGEDSVPKDSPSFTSKPSAEDSAPKEASTANGPNATEETSKPFIHGRHTCDSCLTTPIIGKRFHAINMPDFDLCASCMESYTGKDTKFEVVELDRDRIFQARWQRRHAKWGARGRCRGPNRPSGLGGRRFPHGGRPCGPRGFGHPHGPFHGPPHGPPPPFGPPHGPPPPHGHLPHGPPPPFGPPHGPPPPFLHPMRPPQVAETEENDLALMEAIRQSMESVAASFEDDMAVKPEDKPEPQNAEKDKESAKLAASCVSEEDAAKPEDKSAKKKVPEEVNLVEKSREESVTGSTDASIAECEGSPENTSFAREAAGCGEVAEGLGETLDIIGSAIDDVNLELARTSNYDPEESSDDEEAEIVIDAVCTLNEAPGAEEAGASIVEGNDEVKEEGSVGQNSWEVVADDQIAKDAAIARAAEMLGSSLFSSQENVMSRASADSHVSSITSVPTTVPSIAPAEGQVPQIQLNRWENQLKQLHELGFMNDQLSVEVIERLNAANIGVDSEEEVTVQQVIEEMMKDW